VSELLRREGVWFGFSLVFLKLSEGEGRITIFAAQSTSRTFNYQVWIYHTKVSHFDCFF
jgi:hypothetical protein